MLTILRTITLRLLYAIFIFAALTPTLLSNSHGQVRTEPTLTKTEIAEAAAVLKALTKNWALMDYGSKLDFLVLVNEDREELNFYPKKSFVTRMETLELIENVDKQGSSVREPYTHYESDGSVWKKVIEEGPILFEYRVTPKGLKLLRDAPKLTGRPIRALKPATSPLETESQPLSVVIYDRPAIQKLLDAFNDKAILLIKAAFGSNLDLDRSGLVCGSKLWKILGPAAKRNGLQTSLSLTLRTIRFPGNGSKQTETETKLEDQPISDEKILWQTLRQEFKIDGPVKIRRATRAEWSAYPYPEELSNDDFPTPQGLSVSFVVERNTLRFLVLVKNEPDNDIEHIEPELKWIEIMSDK
jgi:hypothetical protein